MDTGVPAAVEQLQKHVRALMKAEGWSQADLARRAKVSPKTISNMVNAKHSSQIGNIAKVASVWNLAAWQLLSPANPDDLRAGKPLDKLLQNYVSASERGQEAIDRVAETEADRNRPSRNGGADHHPRPEA